MHQIYKTETLRISVKDQKNHYIRLVARLSVFANGTYICAVNKRFMAMTMYKVEIS